MERKKEFLNRLPNFVLVGLLGLNVLTGCNRFDNRFDKKRDLSITSPAITQLTETPKIPFFTTGEIRPGESWDIAVTRLFTELYPGFAGINILINYGSVIAEPRLDGNDSVKEGFNCVVFPDKFSAQQGVDLLYGNGVEDDDNLLGPLWRDQKLAVGKTDTLSDQRKALGCSPNEYWIVVANREYTTDPNPSTQTITIELARRKVSESEPGLTTAFAIFRFYNGDFNNWQGEWEVKITDKWLPVKRLKEKLQQGIDFNEAILQLQNEVKQQSKN